jgi:hypothetical protein
VTFGSAHRTAPRPLRAHRDRHRSGASAGDRDRGRGCSGESGDDRNEHDTIVSVPRALRSSIRAAAVRTAWLTGGVAQPQLAPAPVTTRPEVDATPDTEEPRHAHIVKVGPGESATAKVVEARIYGTPVEALCGFVWVPSRDPKQLPVCEKCKSIYELYRAFNDGLDETPAD